MSDSLRSFMLLLAKTCLNIVLFLPFSLLLSSFLLLASSILHICSGCSRTGRGYCSRCSASLVLQFDQWLVILRVELRTTFHYLQ